MISSFKPEFFGDSNGVISYFISLSNPTIDELVEVVARDSESSFQPKNILYSSAESDWRSSSNSTGNFIYIHLLQHHLLIKNYTIRQYNNYDKLKNWLFEGSNDGSEWIVLDSQPPSSSFCFNNNYYSFPSLSGIYSYFRIRQNGSNCYDNLYMRLSGMELFGELCSSSDISLCRSYLINSLSNDSCLFHIHNFIHRIILLFISQPFLINY